MGTSDLVSACIVLAAVSVAAITDIWKFKIYNVLTFPLILSGFAFHAVTGGAAGMSFSAAGILFGLFALMIPFILGAIGAGDAKLIAGIGAWLGAPLTAVVFLVAAIGGGIYSLFILLRRGSVRQCLLGLQLAVFQVATLGRHLGAQEGIGQVVQKADARRRVVPFGAMVAVAVVIVVVWTHVS